MKIMFASGVWPLAIFVAVNLAAIYCLATLLYLCARRRWQRAWKAFPISLITALMCVCLWVMLFMVMIRISSAVTYNMLAN